MAEFVRHDACPDCRANGRDTSGDNLAVYDDGSTYCFACKTSSQPEGGSSSSSRPFPHQQQPQRATPTSSTSGELVPVDWQPFPTRRVSLNTAKRYGYGVGARWGQVAQVAEYVDAFGRVVAQHFRSADKRFAWAGDRSKALPLWGMQLYKPGRRVAITEGEHDALALSEALGGSWPVVSLPSGAADAVNAVGAALGWLEQFEQVVLMFDEDEAGRAAVEKCSQLFTPGKVCIASLPGKDPSELWMDGRGDDLTRAFWQATPHKPGGLVTVRDVLEEAKKPAEMGKPWPFPSLTSATFGRRNGEVTTWGAGTGVGKTDLFTQCIAHTLTELESPVAAIYLEGSPVDTVTRVAGKIAGKPFWVPGAGWTETELHQSLEQLADGPALHLLDHFGAKDWGEIRGAIRHLAIAEGVQDFFLDHLTALADPGDERRSLEVLMEEVASLAVGLGVSVNLVSHLATPEGVPHEEGGRVMIRHFRGSRAIGFWSHFLFGLERDTQSDDPAVQGETRLRILKDRFTGRGTGTVIPLSYDHATGRLFESAAEATPDDFAAANHLPHHSTADVIEVPF